jgi:hypothetical protein
MIGDGTHELRADFGECSLRADVPLVHLETHSSNIPERVVEEQLFGFAIHVRSPFGAH